MWPHSTKCSFAAGSTWLLTIHVAIRSPSPASHRPKQTPLLLPKSINPADVAQTRSSAAPLAARESDVTLPDLICRHQVRHQPEPCQSVQLCQSHLNSMGNTNHSKRSCKLRAAGHHWQLSTILITHPSTPHIISFNYIFSKYPQLSC